MICPHCHQAFKTHAIEMTRGRGLAVEFQCPKCQAWLGKSAWLQRGKLLGFYGAVAMAIVAYTQPHLFGMALVAGMFCVITLMVSHLMDQLQIREKPAESK
ncbi:hypothetical protein [Shewanella sp. NIFS-20-20]|uniref:hypothetical protein n=1 Tax=Shewanella sp. NIFS-20-20 TaxID=2853806 RepID=UPI001C46ECB4|nr:hypothetical protein [Shewanella sp. NIFS-20-20]MBV7316194.1 hypothetical protein [Shewanella sp. NIFS-20-20]